MKVKLKKLTDLLQCFETYSCTCFSQYIELCLKLHCPIVVNFPLSRWREILFLFVYLFICLFILLQT